MQDFIEQENFNIYHADAFEEIKKIEDQSVDLILTDLPYGTMKNAKFYDYCGGDFDKRNFLLA